MSILIKDMDMPTMCLTCPFECRGNCMVSGKDVEEFEYGGIKDTNCPLVEVPPHGDLVDREELLENAGGVYTARPEEAQKIQREINKVLFVIKDAPAVIEAEGE